MVTTKFEKGAVYVTGKDTKHLEVLRFKEDVTLERRPDGFYRNGQRVDIRQYCVRVHCPKDKAAKILARMAAAGRVKVMPVSNGNINKK